MLERIGKVKYKLELPPGSPVHPVFHVSQLRYTLFAEFLILPALGSLHTVPKCILDRRLVKKGNSATMQVLIRWTGLPVDAATWKDWGVLKTCFPLLLAWGQAISSPGDLSRTSSRLRPGRRHLVNCCNGGTMCVL